MATSTHDATRTAGNKAAPSRSGTSDVYRTREAVPRRAPVPPRGSNSDRRDTSPAHASASVRSGAPRVPARDGDGRSGVNRPTKRVPTKRPPVQNGGHVVRHGSARSHGASSRDNRSFLRKWFESLPIDESDTGISSNDGASANYATDLSDFLDAPQKPDRRAPREKSPSYTPESDEAPLPDYADDPSPTVIRDSGKARSSKKKAESVGQRRSDERNAAARQAAPRVDDEVRRNLRVDTAQSSRQIAATNRPTAPEREYDLPPRTPTNSAIPRPASGNMNASTGRTANESLEHAQYTPPRESRPDTQDVPRKTIPQSAIPSAKSIYVPAEPTPPPAPTRAKPPMPTPMSQGAQSRDDDPELERARQAARQAMGSAAVSAYAETGSQRPSSGAEPQPAVLGARNAALLKAWRARFDQKVSGNLEPYRIENVYRAVESALGLCASPEQLDSLWAQINGIVDKYSSPIVLEHSYLELNRRLLESRVGSRGAQSAHNPMTDANMVHYAQSVERAPETASARYQSAPSPSPSPVPAPASANVPRRSTPRPPQYDPYEPYNDSDDYDSDYESSDRNYGASANDSEAEVMARVKGVASNVGKAALGVGSALFSKAKSLAGQKSRGDKQPSNDSRSRKAPVDYGDAPPAANYNDYDDYNDGYSDYDDGGSTNNASATATVKATKSSPRRTRSYSEPKDAQSRATIRSRSRGNPLRRILTVAALIAVLLGGYFGIKLLADVKSYESTFYPGVYLDGYQLVGQTKVSAYTQLSAVNQYRIDNADLTLTYGEKSWSITNEQLGVSLDTQALVEDCWQKGHAGNMFDRQSEIVALRTSPYVRFTKISYDTAVLDQFITGIKSEIDRPSVDASVTFDPNAGATEKFTITDDVVGREIDAAELTALCDAALRSGRPGNISISPKLSEPALKAADVAVSTNKLVSFSTELSKNANRTANVRLALSKYNGMVVLPGEQVDFNKLVGPRTEEAGFNPAPEYAGTDVIEGIGGGVCQASTTLYGALLRAGLQIDYRANHNMTVSYVPASLDAAVSYPGKSLTFTNNSDYPIFFDTLVTDDKASVAIYGYNMYPGIDITVESVVLETDEAKYETISDPNYEHTQYAGDYFVETRAYNGIVSCAYRVFTDRATGKVIKKEELGTDRYNKRDGVRYYGGVWNG